MKTCVAERLDAFLAWKSGVGERSRKIFTIHPFLRLVRETIHAPERKCPRLLERKVLKGSLEPRQSSAMLCEVGSPKGRRPGALEQFLKELCT